VISVLSGFLQNEDGQGMVEYGLIIALVALAVVSILIALGDILYNRDTGSTGTIMEAVSNNP